MDSCIKIQTILQIEKKKWLFLVGLVALTHLFCQSLMLPYGNALLSLLPNDKSKQPLVMVSASNLDNESLLVRRMKNYNIGMDTEDEGKESMNKEEEEKKNSNINDDFDFVEDETMVNVNVDMEEGFMMHNASGEFATLPPLVVTPDKLLLIKSVVEKKSESEGSVSNVSNHRVIINERKDVPFVSSNGSLVPMVKRKMRCEMPPKSVTPINEMERLLVRHRARSRAMVCIFLDLE